MYGPCIILHYRRGKQDPCLVRTKLCCFDFCCSVVLLSSLSFVIVLQRLSLLCFALHLRTGVKPFECLTCGVAWADARSLKRHVRTHTGERPYVCPVCNEAYIDARTLRKHMTKFHRDYVPCKIMLEKDTLQFHNQGTQVEHAISILAADMQEQETEISVGGEEIETVVVTGDTLEAIEAVATTEQCTSVSTLSDQSIMQVVNYVLAQQQGQKMAEVTQAMETVEVEVAHVTETE